MRRLGTVAFVTIFCVQLSVGLAFGADAQSQGPDFKEVYGLVKDHLEGVTEAELNRAAVQGLVSSLAPRVSLVGNENTTDSGKSLVSKTNLFEGGLAYVRIAKVGDGLGKAVGDACRGVMGTNKLNGVVLDMRFTGGDDYEAVPNAAELFVKTDQPLLDWGKGVVHSSGKSDTLGVPATVLLNRETAGAAEALAAVLREAGAGLLLGSKTAGQAMVAREFPLSDGEKLRIASAPVRLADGSAMSSQGVKPDIEVNVSPQDEKAYFADPFKDLRRTNLVAAGSLTSTNGAAGTNRVRRTRFNEAELVRQRREGFDPDLEVTTDDDLERPTVRDPVLARALDVLKGLTVVRQSRS
jgi:C-terminal processing protease CtpA/Prc